MAAPIPYSEEELDACIWQAAAINPAIWAHLCSNGQFEMWPHSLLMGQYLARVAYRKIRRLFINASIRHGKSLLTCLWFPVWYLCKWPTHRVLIVTYNANLAEEWGAKCRELFRQLVGPVSGDTAQKGNWHIIGPDGDADPTERPGMTAVGKGGTMTGRGYNLIIVSDPFKDQKEALSVTVREDVWEKWRGTIRGRLEPGGVVVGEMARYHEDDLPGRIKVADEPYKEWEWLILPAQAYDGEEDPLKRKPGEPLCPQRYSTADLDEWKREADLGPAWFMALAQQRPLFTSEMDALLSKADMEAVTDHDRASWQTAPIPGHLYWAGIDWGATNPTALTIVDCTRIPDEVVEYQEWSKADAIEIGPDGKPVVDDRFYLRTAMKIAQFLMAWKVVGFDDDVTGVGAGAHEMLVSAVKGLGHPCAGHRRTFTLSEKVERLAQPLLSKVWKSHITFPACFARLIQEILDMQYVNAKGERYAAKTGVNHHGDGFWATALAVRSPQRGPADGLAGAPEKDIMDRVADSQRRAGKPARKKGTVGM